MIGSIFELFFVLQSPLLQLMRTEHVKLAEP